MKDQTGTSQNATVNIGTVYRRNWLRDENEPWLFTDDVESLRAAVEHFCHPSHVALLNRIISAAELAACHPPSALPLSEELRRLVEQLDERLSVLRLHKRVGDEMWGDGVTGFAEDIVFFERLKSTLAELRGDLDLSSQAHYEVREICKEVGAEAAFVDDAVREVVERLKVAEAALSSLSGTPAAATFRERGAESGMRQDDAGNTMVDVVAPAPLQRAEEPKFTRLAQHVSDEGLAADSTAAARAMRSFKAGYQVAASVRETSETPLVERLMAQLESLTATVNAAVPELRAALDAALLSIESRDGVLAMTVARLGGTVEGQPTHRINFLQRIDELREIERRAALQEAQHGR